MPKQFDLLVFDWDGTLMDSAGTIVNSIQSAALDLGLAPPSDARARHVIGLGLGEALRYAVPELAEERHEELADRYRHHYLAQDHELVLFEGAAELVETLGASGHMLAIATGKSRKGLDRALDASGLRPLFHGTRCADECHSKPHPQMLEELMAEFGIAPDATLMIGDTTHDLLMAQNAGVAGVGVTHGAHTVEALESAGPLHLADCIEGLRQWLVTNA